MKRRQDREDSPFVQIARRRITEPEEPSKLAAVLLTVLTLATWPIAGFALYWLVRRPEFQMTFAWVGGFALAALVWGYMTPLGRKAYPRR